MLIWERNPTHTGLWLSRDLGTGVIRRGWGVSVVPNQLLDQRIKAAVLSSCLFLNILREGGELCVYRMVDSCSLPQGPNLCNSSTFPSMRAGGWVNLSV